MQKHSHNLVIVIAYFKDAEEEVLESIHFVSAPDVCWEAALDSALTYMQREPSVHLDHYESIMAYLTHADVDTIGVNNKVVYIEKH